ncbi:MAG: heme biosynthesis protein HemY [Gammaproteobacteria bacterium]|nr:heme biosynthesis protein HemY [Gammaproteobacteria bacterium]
MKFLLFLLLILFAATAAALLLLSDAGYVLIAVGDWTVEMSLAVLAVLILFAFAVLYYALRLAGGARRLPRRVGQWREHRRHRKARRNLTEGLLAYAEGEWDQAERRLLQRADDSETPLLHYLSAARAAQEQGADDRRDHYLRLAHETLPEAALAIGLTQAELQLEHGQLEQAEATLDHLMRRAPRHRQVLKLQARLLLELGAWERLAALLPELRRRRAVPAGEYGVLELKVHGELLDEAASERDADHLAKTWRGVPKELRGNELLLQTYARHLIDLQRGDLAEPLLRDALNRRMSDRLARLYGLVDGGKPARQLEVAEGWLAGDARNPVLLLTVGRLAMRNKLWGKARSAFESSLAIEPTVEGQRELAALHEHLGETDAAAACYREAARLAAEASGRGADGPRAATRHLPAGEPPEAELLRAAEN